jgi:hypothetical protein
MSKKLLEQIRNKGLSYSAYKEKVAAVIAQGEKDTMSADEHDKYNFTKLNQTRINRIDKTYSPSVDVIEAINKITTPQTWLILTAVWCGDSAQNVPQLVKIAESNSLIDVKLIERDENLEIMDEFLTDGKRSIPKLITLNDNGEILFTWGSRPAAAQALVRNAIDSGIEKKVWEEQLHLWYARNKGKDLEQELTHLTTIKHN